MSSFASSSTWPRFASPLHSRPDGESALLLRMSTEMGVRQKVGGQRSIRFEFLILRSYNDAPPGAVSENLARLGRSGLSVGSPTRGINNLQDRHPRLLMDSKWTGAEPSRYGYPTGRKLATAQEAHPWRGNCWHLRKPFRRVRRLGT